MGCVMIGQTDGVLLDGVDFVCEDDLVFYFVEDCCFVGPMAHEKMMDLYSIFFEWWSTNVSKKHVIRLRKFSKIIREIAEIEKGFFIGVCLKPHILHGGSND